ncbi:MAG: hypothetical protein SGARI_003440 [Bacillariaceae sp.]
MCNTTDSYDNNNNDHKMTVSETAQELGNAMARKATETKDSVTETLIGAKETTVDHTSAAKDAAIDKTYDARDFAAEQIGSLKDTVAPPPEEPKTLGDRLGDVQSSVKNVTSNIQPHPDDLKKQALEEEKMEPHVKPLGARINDSAQSAKESLDQFGQDTKLTAQAKTISARSWTADKLDNLQSTVEPPRLEEEPKSFVGGILDGLQSKIDDARAPDDPHEDPKLRGDSQKIL